MKKLELIIFSIYLTTTLLLLSGLYYNKVSYGGGMGDFMMMQFMAFELPIVLLVYILSNIPKHKIFDIIRKVIAIIMLFLAIIHFIDLEL
jgi:hypothetical protein